MKVKLKVHERKYRDDDLLINPKDFPDVDVGDVLEIYPQEVEYSRLLLQVTTLDLQNKDTISIESSVVSAFQLKPYIDVIVNKVDPKNVMLDLVELLYKEQYYSRSDMWRMRKFLVDTCAYVNKKIEFAEMRTQVNELWSRGERVTCGVIDKDTRVVFRSSTAVVQIFIQMSSEMWDFDVHGDLYFEKAVNGFLTDLFVKWKEQNCCHDVTIVLFSRTFYDVQSKEEFPTHMQEWIQQDYKGRFYEDFYRIVVQNERYEDWINTLIQLRTIFNEYPEKVLHYHESGGCKMPRSWNSSASQGNFLETLNMSLNLFERYYLDRNFDRTGQVAVVITPGPGVFEVDRELTNITKQRTIDCGVGSDLVCMGEQPLHAAPLFKFHSKTEKVTLEVGDDYNIPHWMNHSFYTAKAPFPGSTSSFVPRIKPPKMLENIDPKSKEKDLYTPPTSYESDDDFTLVDYDEYDAQVFKVLSRGTPKTCVGRTSSFYKSVKGRAATIAEAKRQCKTRTRYISDDFSGVFSNSETKVSQSAAISIPTPSHSCDSLGSPLGSYPLTERTKSHETVGSADSEDGLLYRPIVGSAGSPVGHSKNYTHSNKPRRALINPFAPSRMRFKMTSNRRRWVHAFPKDPTGAAVQPHHIHNISNSIDDGDSESSKDGGQASKKSTDSQGRMKGCENDGVSSYEDPVLSGKSCSPSLSLFNMLGSVSNHCSFLSNSAEQGKSALWLRGQVSGREPNKTWLWGPTGEQEWSPDMTTGQLQAVCSCCRPCRILKAGWDWRPLDKQETANAQSRLIKPILTADYHSQYFCAGISVDWKSLTIPASLPITTDFFPDKRSLHYDYVLSDYDLVPVNVNSDYWMNQPKSEDESCYRKEPLNTEQVFKELISQRLGQGFQLIVFPQNISEQFSSNQHSTGLYRVRHKTEDSEECYLSIGRVYHKLTRVENTITVTRYRPRHPHPEMHYDYHYRFEAPDSDKYELSWTVFKNEKLENYNWNFLDHYTCTHGEGDYQLREDLKFWRSRFFLLPCNNLATKKIIDGSLQYVSANKQRCDIYEEKSSQELKTLISGFLRFLEFLNKIKRPAQTRWTTKPQAASPQTPNMADNKSLAGDSVDKKSESLGSSSNKEEKLCTDSATQKIIQAMLDTKTGLPFLTKQPGLPANSFISAEAVSWCMQQVSGVETVLKAAQLMQKLLNEQLVCHTSGNVKHKFLYGFYLYFIVNKEVGRPGVGLDLPYGTQYNYMFQNEWCEVSVVSVPDEDDEKIFSLSDNLQSCFEYVLPSCEDWRPQSPASASSGNVHKYVNVDVDPNNKSDRTEWARARYSALYSPKCVFELEIEWMVATGNILGELIYSWARKTPPCGFHLLPVPLDPFALPSCPTSDPLRGPIYIHLNVDSLLNSGEYYLFSEYDEARRSEKILHFQKALIKRYGFLNINIPVPSSMLLPEPVMEQYVHSSGGMFVLIADLNTIPPPTQNKFTKSSSSELHRDYIARQASSSDSCHFEDERLSIGYLWSWNYMLSKRWRSANTGDEHFQDKILADFREFCSNKSGRLRKFWEQYNSD